jgi:hypothetical protein
MPRDTLRQMNLKDRILGCILGGALGDAWSGPWEGRVGPVQFQIPVRPKLSDDTELTLATCESMIETGTIEPENVATHFVRWFKGGRIHGIGSSTLKAMRDLSAGTHWALSGAGGEFDQLFFAAPQSLVSQQCQSLCVSLTLGQSIQDAKTARSQQIGNDNRQLACARPSPQPSEPSCVRLFLLPCRPLQPPGVKAAGSVVRDITHRHVLPNHPDGMEALHRLVQNTHPRPNSSTASTDPE